MPTPEATPLDSTLPLRSLGRNGPQVTRLGLGLAALGRPSYHNLGHGSDVGEVRTVDALKARCHEVLDAAWEQGVRYLDVARSYGLGESFLADWLDARGLTRDAVTVGSKWGYVYTAGWRDDADVHEVKDHSVANLLKQQDESWALLSPWLATYSIHSATLESGVLDDDAVLDALARLRSERGLRVGLTVTGPNQADVVRRAIALRGGGFFDVVQATCNLLEPSVLPALIEAHDAGLGVVVKESLANGRLTPRAPHGPTRDLLFENATQLDTTPDALAIAWLLEHDAIDVVLSGAATAEQIQSHARATQLRLDDATRAALGTLATPADDYWAARRALPWT